MLSSLSVDKQALSNHISTLQSKVEKLKSEIVCLTDLYIDSIYYRQPKMFINLKFSDLVLLGPIFLGANGESKGRRR